MLLATQGLWGFPACLGAHFHSYIVVIIPYDLVTKSICLRRCFKIYLSIFQLLSTGGWGWLIQPISIIGCHNVQKLCSGKLLLMHFDCLHIALSLFSSCSCWEFPFCSFSSVFWIRNVTVLVYLSPQDHDLSQGHSLSSGSVSSVSKQSSSLAAFSCKRVLEGQIARFSMVNFKFQSTSLGFLWSTSGCRWCRHFSSFRVGIN